MEARRKGVFMNNFGDRLKNIPGSFNYEIQRNGEGVPTSFTVWSGQIVFGGFGDPDQMIWPLIQKANELWKGKERWMEREGDFYANVACTLASEMMEHLNADIKHVLEPLLAELEPESLKKR